MLSKRWTDLPVPSSYRAVGRADRNSQRSAVAPRAALGWPAFAAAPALAVLVAVHGVHTLRAEAEAAAAEAEAVVAVAAADAVAAPSVAAPRLDREQTEIARFIARTYRVASEHAGHVVDLAYRVAREFRLDPHLLLAVVAVESRFVVDAQSPKGAQGLMQVLTHVHAEKFAPYGGVSAAFDPMANLRVGARILREYIARNGTVEAGLKAYVGAALLPEDGGYGSKVLFERDRLAAVAAGRALPVRAVVPEVPADAGPVLLNVERSEAGARLRGEVPADAGVIGTPLTAPVIPGDVPGQARAFGSEA